MWNSPTIFFNQIVYFFIDYTTNIWFSKDRLLSEKTISKQITKKITSTIKMADEKFGNAYLFTFEKFELDFLKENRVSLYFCLIIIKHEA